MKRCLFLLIALAWAACACANPLWPEMQPVPEFDGDYTAWSCPIGGAFNRAVPPAQERLGWPSSVTCYAGEPCGVIVGFYSLTDGGMIRLSAEDSPFTIRVGVVTFQGRRVPPRPDEGRYLGIPLYVPERQEAELRAGENTVYWLTINPPVDISPGSYGVGLRFERQDVDRTYHGDEGDRALARHRYGGQADVLALRVNVLPPPPESQRAFGVYYNGGRFPPEFNTPEWEARFMRDMAEHGHTSAFYGSWAKDLGFNKTGKVALDGSELARRTQVRLDAGLIRPDVPVLLIGHSAGDYGGEYVAFATALKEAWGAKGWPEIVLYGPDEPGIKQLEPWPQLKAVRSVLRTGTALPHASRETGAYFDVWILDARDTTDDVIALGRDMDAELWTYSCIHRGTNAAWHRFYAGLYTWAHGFRGNWLWAYTHTPDCRWEGDRTDHRGMVSISKSGPVPMVGWEARREGIMDCRVLTHLEAHADAGAAAWLAGLRARVPVRCDVDADDRPTLNASPYYWDGMDLYPPPFTGEEMESIRRRAESYIGELTR